MASGSRDEQGLNLAGSSSKNNEQANEDIKSKAKLVSEEINSLLNYLKIFQEIITTVEEKHKAVLRG